MSSDLDLQCFRKRISLESTGLRVNLEEILKKILKLSPQTSVKERKRVEGPMDKYFVGGIWSLNQENLSSGFANIKGISTV